jgi:hypothetical protein
MRSVVRQTWFMLMDERLTSEPEYLEMKDVSKGVAAAELWTVDKVREGKHGMGEKEQRGGQGAQVDVIREAATLEELEGSGLQLRCSADERDNS